jgi:hypothetical protein
MEIRIRETGQVMYEDEFRQAYMGWVLNNPKPALSLEILDTLGADVVLEGPQATGGTVYQYSQRDGVFQSQDGRWFTKYILGPVFTDAVINGVAVTALQRENEYKARIDADRAVIIRDSRNKLLAECDWTQLADSSVNKVAWATYRQQLRDVPSTDGFPWNVIWPTKPE